MEVPQIMSVMLIVLNRLRKIFDGVVMIWMNLKIMDNTKYDTIWMVHIGNDSQNAKKPAET